MRYFLLSACLLLALNGNAQMIGTDTLVKSPPIYGYAQQMPATPYNLSEYLSQNIHYPDTAMKYHIEGRVVVKFVVNEDGSISDCHIIKGIGGGCDEEALRVVKNMAAWSPGRKDGLPVKVYFTLPIVFKLTN